MWTRTRKTLRLGGLLLLLALCGRTIASAGERDPDYNRVLSAYRAHDFTSCRELGRRFLAEKPGYRFAHSVRFMIADSYRQEKRLKEAATAFEDYLAHHPDESLADRSRGALVEVLNEDHRYAEALARAEDYLKRWPKGRAAPGVRYQRAVALEELRRFEEAAAAYAGLDIERAAYRRGIALFRGRDFAGSRRALTAFLARYPDSPRREAARDYLSRTGAEYDRIEKGIVYDYHGKYERDPRFLAIRDRLPGLRAAALAELESTLSVEVPRDFLIRFEDADTDRSGNFASTRLEVVSGRPCQVVVLYTEYLVLDACDLSRTLVHEFFHALSREELGEDHFLLPKWVREGAALYVAGQTEERTLLLAVEIGRRPGNSSPLATLVNGLAGRHTFTDYAEDVSAFAAAEERHGREKTLALVRRLLKTTDVKAAVREVLGEDFATFERAADDRARRVLRPLLVTGRDRVRLARARIDAGEWDAALAALDGDVGAYGPVAAWLRARALLGAGRPGAALKVAREEYLARYRHYPTMLDDVIRIEVRALEELGSPEAKAAADRAAKDLAPAGGL